MLKKLKKAKTIEELERAISTQDPTTDCISIPRYVIAVVTERSLADRLMDVSKSRSGKVFHMSCTVACGAIRMCSHNISFARFPTAATRSVGSWIKSALTHITTRRSKHQVKKLLEHLVHLQALPPILVPKSLATNGGGLSSTGELSSALNTISVGIERNTVCNVNTGL